MKITVNLDDETVDSYLDNINDVCNTTFAVSNLTLKQRKAVAIAFADEMQGELEMRCDDHSGFETERYFNEALDLGLDGEDDNGDF